MLHILAHLFWSFFMWHPNAKPIASNIKFWRWNLHKGGSCKGSVEGKEQVDSTQVDTHWCLNQNFKIKHSTQVLGLWGQEANLWSWHCRSIWWLNFSISCIVNVFTFSHQNFGKTMNWIKTVKVESSNLKRKYQHLQKTKIFYLK